MRFKLLLASLLVGLGSITIANSASARCDYPDDVDSRGRRCGGRASSVRPGGYDPDADGRSNTPSKDYGDDASPKLPASGQGYAAFAGNKYISDQGVLLLTHEYSGNLSYRSKKGKWYATGWVNVDYSNDSHYEGKFQDGYTNSDIKCSGRFTMDRVRPNRWFSVWQFDESCNNEKYTLMLTHE